MPVSATPRSLSVIRKSKFWNERVVARKKFRGTFSVSEPPVIIPSCTFHHFRSPSQPVRVLPSESDSAATIGDRQAVTETTRVNSRVFESDRFIGNEEDAPDIRRILRRTAGSKVE